jgi:zinc/manganese transport system permease protein
MTFSINPWIDLQQMLQYQFMQHAFEAGTVVAILAGIVGYFVVLRRSAFAAHALSHIGFSGAAAAVLIGVSPIYGLLLFTSVGGIGIAALGRRAASRDAEIGIVLAFMLGLGVLFLSLYTGYATEAYSILFGEILGVSFSNVLLTLVAGLGGIIGGVLGAFIGLILYLRNWPAAFHTAFFSVLGAVAAWRAEAAERS